MRLPHVYSASVAFIVGLPAVTQAQNEPALRTQDSTTLEEVVVTAQKRIQNVQDVGIAITALSGADLQALGNRDMTALVTQAPSVQVNSYGSTLTVFNVRGVSQNDISDAQEAPIAFYNDEVYVSSLGAISGQNFDLERIEVLRGPQGTLFGRNATGGLVQLVTAAPTKTFEGYATVTGGRFDQISTDAAVSGPLGERVRGRMAVATNHNDGFVENTLGGPNGGNARYYAGRGQLEFDIGERGVLRTKLEYLSNDGESYIFTHRAAGFDSDGLGFRLAPDQDFWTGRLSPFGAPIVSCPGCDTAGYRASDDPYKSTVDTRSLTNRDFWSATARYDQNLGFADLTSVSNYQHLRKYYLADSDASPFPLFNVQSEQQLEQYSEELRLSGNAGRLNWVTGLYGLKIHTDVSQRLGTPPSVDPAFAFFDVQSYTLDTKSLAGFAQVEYALSNLFSLIAGARYSADWKEYDWVGSGSFGYFNEFNRALYPDLADRKFTDYSGKIELDFKPNDDSLLYLSANRGTKSGGFNVQAFRFDPNQIPFDAEVLTSYEGGFKLSLANKRMQLNGALFYYDYDGYQSFITPGPGQTTVTNQPAKVGGAELEFEARPVSRLTLGLWAANLFRARVYDLTLPFGRNADRDMPQAPRWSAGAKAAYVVPVGAGSLTLWSNWKYDGAQFFNAFNSPLAREPSRVIGDVRASFTLDNWDVALFVNNVTDKAYRLFANDSGVDLGAEQAIYASPRWWGASVTYRFGGGE